MNHYPDGYQYGQDGSNMQGVGYTSYSNPTTSHQNQSGMDYYRGSYPMMPQQMGSNPVDMYGQSRHRLYGHVSGYGHYHHMTPGHMAHHPSMMGSYYGSSGPTTGPANGHSGYNHTQAGSYQNPQQHRMIGPAQPNHSALGVNPGKYQGHVQQQPHVQAPPHPMRQTNAQQNPQEVADNILQMASAYPSNQTVQVPLKNRPAPYHIPRSPHYTSRPELAQHSSPSPQQHLQPSPVSSPSSGAIRSPNASRCSPSRAGMTYSNQTLPQDSGGEVEQIAHQSRSPHFSPNVMVSSPTYTPHSNVHHTPQQSQFSNHHSTLSSHGVNSTPASDITSSSQGGHRQGFVQNSAAANNPLMSLEKLVMLPETQVVDPKSVVNDSCLSQSDEVPKNVEDPAERLAESSGHSVGSSVVFCSRNDLSDSGCGTSSKRMTPEPQTPAENSCGSSLNLSVASSMQQSDLGLESSQNCSKSEASSKTSQIVDSTCSSSTPIISQGGDPSFGPSICSISSFLTDNESYQSSTNISSKNCIASSQASFRAAADGDKIYEIKSLPMEQRGSYPTTQRGEFSSGPVCNEFVAQSSTPNSNSVRELPADENVQNTLDQLTKIADSDTGSIDNYKIQIPADSTSPQSNQVKESDFSENHSEQSEISSIDTGSFNSKFCSVSESSVVSEVFTSTKSNSETSKAEVKYETDCSPSEGVKVPCLVQDAKCFYNAGLGEGKAEDNIVEEPCHNGKGLPNASMENKIGSHVETTSIRQELLQNPLSVNGSNPLLCKEVILKKKEEPFLWDTSKTSIVKEEAKIPSESPQVPVVLSEMPVIENGIEELSSQSKADLELSSVNGADKLHNGMTTVVKSKVIRQQKVQRHVNMIPCSVAVGACERSVCDGFVYRHNGVRRVTRSSGIRHRCDSTGNADSDESLENISTSSAVFSKEPHDGNRKRGASSSSKRNGFNKSSTVMVSSARQTGSSVNNSGKGNIGKKSYHPSYTSNAVGSDEESCYYEGVDSSYDVFLNSYSSDDSRVSGDEIKNGANGISKDEKEVQKDTNNAKDSYTVESKPGLSSHNLSTCLDEGVSDSHNTTISPPTKKQRHSGSQTPQNKSEEVIDLTLESSSPMKSLSATSIKQQGSHSGKFRPSILARRSPAKYPVVVLDKSAVKSSKILTGKEGSLPPLSSENNKSPPLPKLVFSPQTIKTEESPISQCKVSMDLTFDSPVVKAENVTVSEIKISTNSPVPKKKGHVKKAQQRTMVKSRKKGSLLSEQKPDVKDSFKSMKFNRTLDLIKSNKKRESSGVGPFIRVTGTRSSPQSVSVFAQPTLEQPGKPFSNKKGVSTWPTGTSYMVSDFPGGGLAMVPLQRVVSLKPWVCVFCGKHSSYKMLGDLFGPYFKESEAARADKVALEESKKVGKDLPFDTAIRTKSIPQGQPSSSLKLKPQDTSGHRKQRRKSSLSAQQVDEERHIPEEMWVHQACALWSPGVCLVGNKMYGLEECAKDANENICCLCRSCGATLGCLQKGCQMKYHFACAVESGCHMEEEKFAILCPKHKERKLASASSSKS